MKNRMTSAEYRDWNAGQRKMRGTSTPGLPNRTEIRFAEWRRGFGAIPIFEPVKLRIGPPRTRCWYTPDFIEPSTNGLPIAWEVKGRAANGRYRAEDDALVKIKAAAELYAWLFVFRLAWRDDSDGFQWIDFSS